MRVFTDGAEFADSLFWTVFPSWTVSNLLPRSGVYSYRNALSSAVVITKTIAALSEFYWKGVYNYPLATARLFAWYNGGTEQGSVRLNASTGCLSLYTGTGTLVASGTIPFPINAHVMLEVHVKIADAAGVIETKLDAVSDVSFSGDTKPGTATDVDVIGVAAAGAGTGAPAYLDDIALNNITGGVDDGWCGDGKVALQMPDSAGDVTGLSPSAGSNWECVNELPHNTDTDYVQDTVVDDYDLYNLLPCGLSGVTIQRVWAESRARDTVAAGGLCQVGLKTVATEYWSGDLSLLTTYTPKIGVDHTVNPNTLAAWTTDQLDALQVGFKVR